ncbi:putative endonuclease [Novosphingobium chloroacetimidivorans]|uniref:Putative endonuclease n=1 Tax=Novosphingobium chloroacetimidivorans TaxID=1428314 RepID=A0A7W7NVH8_9SPHN|nr:GIY-YIG nuclease family protein [Novosphingobium chloroacetimidivorans]MBB4857137.1 putative endonuclease [Novosphingobium chloroacetimidivorans]
MAFWAYILKCADGRFYTGHTDDLERRMGEHQHGGFCDFTTRRRPVTLFWSQDFATRYEPLSAELQIKKWSKAKKEALAAGDRNRLSFYARPPRERVSTTLDTNGDSEQRKTDQRGQISC